MRPCKLARRAPGPGIGATGARCTGAHRALYRAAVSAPAERPIDFELPDHAARTFRLSDALRERSAVVVFYRGDW